MNKLKLTVTEAKQKMLLDYGGLYSTNNVADLLGIDHPCVTDMRKRNELLAISVDGKWKYPVFQFQGNRIIPGITRIIKILCSRDGMFWDACLFLLNKHDALVMDDGTCITPIEGIKSGKNIDLIASLAYGRFDQTAN